MPANGTNGQGVGMTDEEIWQIISYIRSVEVKAANSTARLNVVPFPNPPDS
jgi:hypothetical protein